MHVCARTAYPAFRVERGGVAGVRRARRQRHTASGAVARTLTALALTNEKGRGITAARSEEHTSELQSLMRISYAVFCLKKKRVRKPPHIRRSFTTSTQKEKTTITEV